MFLSYQQKVILVCLIYFVTLMDIDRFIFVMMTEKTNATLHLLNTTQFTIGTEIRHLSIFM